MCNIVRSWETVDYKVAAEDSEGFLFLHCDVKSHKLSVAKELKSLIKEVVDWASAEGYDGVHAFTQNKRFANFIPGARHLHDVEFSGEVYGVYKWVQQ